MAVFNWQGSQFFSHARGRILLKADLWCNNPMQYLKTTKKGLQSLIQSLAVLHRILSTSQQCLLRFEAQFSKAVDHVGDLRGKNQLHKLWQDIATLPSAKIHTSFVSTDQKNRSTECIMTFGMTFCDTALPQQQSLTHDIIWHIIWQFSYTYKYVYKSIRFQLIFRKIDEVDYKFVTPEFLPLKNIVPESPAETQVVVGRDDWEAKWPLSQKNPAGSTSSWLNWARKKRKSLSFLAGLSISKGMKSSSQPKKKILVRKNIDVIM